MTFLATVVLASFAGRAFGGDFYPFTNPKWDYNYGMTDCPDECTSENRCGVHCWQLPSAHSDPASNMCGGSSQTPINLPSGAEISGAEVMVDPDLDYPKFTNAGCTSWTQFANDHAFEIAFKNGYEGYDCSNAGLEYNGIHYNLYQFHFHTPSEHTSGGGQYDAEVHMVHISDHGDILVLGVFLNAQDSRVDARNAPLDRFRHIYESTNPGAADAVSRYLKVKDQPMLNPYSFLPASKNYYTYSGSLTTVPCTEGLTWLVFEESVPIGSDDLQFLIDSVANYPDTITYSEYKYNSARPVQPLNGRVLRKYEPSLDLPEYLPMWSQCGGKDWSGPTQCVSHATCTYINHWYSHCTPDGSYYSNGGASSSSSSDVSPATIAAIVVPTTFVCTAAFLGLAYLVYQCRKPMDKEDAAEQVVLTEDMDMDTEMVVGSA